MSRITSSVGLISGIPIEETVTKLMAIAAQPRNIIANRTQTIDNERLAITRLTSLVLAFQFESNRLGASSLFSGKSVASSNESALKATIVDGGNPAVGNYQFRPIQTATAHQLVSASLQSVSDLNTSGVFKFGFGGFVDKGVALSELNGGAGVRAGTIRITDRSGSTADIDLRMASTVDDVLRAINNNTSAGVSASISDDQIVLTDVSGGTGNLKVQDVGTGKTALDLGLAGINVASDTATGSDVFRLHSGTKLASLNDGIGVPLAAGNDLEITFADESVLSIDLGSAKTLGEVISALNAADPAKLSASIASDGNRIELKDLTTGSGDFTVSNVGTGTVADALGLTSDASGDTITGRRLISGLRDTLVSALKAGQGLGSELGVISITNRNNVTSNVNLAGAETLGQIVAAINSQATGVTASINTARNGIELVDTTNGTASNFIVVDGDANASATALGIVSNEAAASINSGSLNRQQVSRATLLSSLLGGEGIIAGDIRITDSSGKVGAVDLNMPGNEAKTLGDIIDRINALTTVDVEARINDTGDGIIIVDTASGAGSLQLANVGNHKTLEALRLAGVATTRDVNGTPRQVIDGTSSYSVDLSGLESVTNEIQLSSLNKGTGVAQGTFLITDTNGNSAAVTVNTSVTTVSDVIAKINATNIGVEARINDAGTGILLYDTAHGSGTLKVQEVAGGRTAADLGLTGNVTTLTIDDVARKAINGAGTFSKNVAQTGLNALATKINNLKAGVTASIINDGTGYRLMMTADTTGSGNELLVDGVAANLDFTELVVASDAVLEIGGQNGSTGLLVRSSDNKFTDVVPGVELTVVAPATQNVTVSISKAQTQISSAINDFVAAFNSVRTNLDEVTSFDSEGLSTGILFGTTAALRVESDLNRVLSGRFIGVGQYSSLESIGLSFNDKGKLVLDGSKLQAALDEDSAAVERLFTDKTLGVSAKLKTTIEALAGEKNSLLATRAQSLADVIKANSERITFMDERLTRERGRLMLTFAQLESTIAGMQQNLSALAGIQVIPPLTSRSRS